MTVENVQSNPLPELKTEINPTIKWIQKWAHQSCLLGWARSALVLPGDTSSNWSTPLHVCFNLTHTWTCSNDIILLGISITRYNTCKLQSTIIINSPVKLDIKYVNRWGISLVDCSCDFHTIKGGISGHTYKKFSTISNSILEYTFAAMTILKASNRPKPCSRLWWNPAVFLTQLALLASTLTAV